ncbi:MAG TPA: hypothetical protein VGY50_08540 [Streptosporangiaceae bacterium]|nr:hypothetical protein [Streptosporangiaceae bacterium]
MTQPGGSGNDLIGDFQRWLLRAGARGMSRELADQVRTALGKTQQQTGGDVWKTATTEPVSGEAPECAWCPLCRAARLVREAKPTRDTRVAAVGDALTTVVQDAVSVLEAALAATSRSGAAPNGKGTETGPGTRGFAAAGSAAAQAPPASSAAAQAAPASPPGAPASPAGQAAPATDEAAPATDEHAAPDPPEESPDEPDDRG